MIKNKLNSFTVCSAAAFIALVGAAAFAQDVNDAGPATGRSVEKSKPGFEDRTQKDEIAPLPGQSKPPVPATPGSDDISNQPSRFGVPLAK